MLTEGLELEVSDSFLSLLITLVERQLSKSRKIKNKAEIPLCWGAKLCARHSKKNWPLMHYVGYMTSNSGWDKSRFTSVHVENN